MYDDIHVLINIISKAHEEYIVATVWTCAQYVLCGHMHVPYHTLPFCHGIVWPLAAALRGNEPIDILAAFI